MSYDSEPETREHIKQVERRLRHVCAELRDRGWRHDSSKLGPNEKPIFDRVTPLLKGLTYGSQEYKDSLKDLGPALAHHYAENTHHPEHYPNGISGMDLLDLIEMYCDWAAATLRTKDGDMSKGLEINIERFGIAGPLADILRNTWKRHGGFCGYQDHRLMERGETKAHDEWTYDFDYTSGGLEVMRRPKPNAPVEPFHDEVMAAVAEKQIA
jgi:hypothetical protein